MKNKTDDMELAMRVSYSETKYERQIEYEFYEPAHPYINEDRTQWNKTLLETCHFNNDINFLISVLDKAVKNYQEKKLQQKYEVFLRKILDAYHNYVAESEENKINKLHPVSYDSLLQLVRFIPELPEKNLDVYLDEMTGCFGVTIKVESKSKPVLNILMRENKEIIFSFIKRKNKIIKISGRAYFNDDLNDSEEIRNIVRMIM